MSHLIILYNRLRLNARAVAFGLLAAILSICLYSAFYFFTPLDPCLISLPVGLFIGHMVSLGALGRRDRFLAAIAVYLIVASYLLGTLPVDLWRNPHEPFTAILYSIYNRFALVFTLREAFDSFGHFVEVGGAWLSFIAGVFLAQKKNE